MKRFTKFDGSGRILARIGLLVALLDAASASGGVITNQASATFLDGSSKQHSTLSNIDSLTTAPVAADLTASLTVSLSRVAPMAPLTYTLSARNAGFVDAAGIAITVDGAPVTAVVLRDVLPLGTTFQSFGAIQASGTTPLYHVTGAPDQSYLSAVPTSASAVDAVAFITHSLTASAQFGGAYTVWVNGNASVQGSVLLKNTAGVLYGSSGIAAGTTYSNTVASTVTAVPGAIQIFARGAPGTPMNTVSIGASLVAQATADACNADPLVAETHMVVITDTSGDRESFTATETGPNTGIFDVSGIRTGLPPVTVGDGVVEGANGDQLNLEILGCGTKIVVTLTLIDPSGVVFDSRTNVLVANATVMLVNASATECSYTAASVSENIGGVVRPISATAVTDASGAYHFPLVPPGYYCLVVEPPPGYAFPSKVTAADQPAGRQIVSTGPNTGGSYGGVFAVSEVTGPVTADLPLDPHALTGLFVEKTVSKSIAEVGDFVDYTISIADGTGLALPPGGALADALPTGFMYEPGSTRLNGVSMTDPQGGRGPLLTFRLPALPLNTTTSLSYRVKLGQSAMRGDGVNRAQVRVGTAVSNLASASVRVEGGVFGDDAFVLGKVYLDCNGDKAQGVGDDGIPGVRLYLEDGTNVITDSEGKYSIYGISAKTHVLKLDRTSLPSGATLEVLSNRNAQDPGSVFVDAQKGELHKTDFASTTCTAAVVQAVAARRKSMSSSSSKATERMLAAHLDADSSIKPLSDVRGLPASGVVGSARESGPFNSLSTDYARVAPAVAAPIIPIIHVDPAVALEALLPQLDNQLGFIGLNDRDTLPIAQTNIRVKGTLGSSFLLTVNGKEVAATRVGKKSVLAEKSLQAWEYVGIDLVPGTNHLAVAQTDQFGNARGSVAIDVTAPDRLATLEALVQQEVVADGRSSARILVRLTDANGIPVTVRTPVTLEASLGRWDAEDLDPRDPGVQVFIEGGSREFRLIAPAEPGESKIRITAGALHAATNATFLPDLRPLIASGILEGVLNLRRLDTNALTPAQRQDGFEQQLSNLSRTWGDGKEEAAARAAVFLKGKIRGDYLLTLGYDSDKDTRGRLFRDIQPDQFYPVYGDSAVRGFDAQSTGRLYVRIDKGRSWLLYGDLTTQSSTEARQLSNYNRSLTGLKEHYETRKVVVNAFASNDSTTQVIEEIKADGTSGPFVLTTPNLVENSERVDILVRDRNQPALIIQTTSLQRFVDYEMEPLTGTLLLKAPVASLDPNFNPQSIRVTYEVDQGGAKFWVGGADAQVKLSSRVEVGGVFIDDRNPANPAKLEGANSTVKLGAKTFMVAEVAETDSALGGEGTGERVELKHDDGALQARVYADKTDLTFNNPGSSVTPGHSEYGARAVYKINDTLSLRGESIRSEDATTTGQLNGAIVTAEKRLKHGVRVEVGAREARRDAQATSAGTTPAAAAARSLTAPAVDLNSLRMKVSVPVPHVPRAGIYGEYEQDVRDDDKKLAAVGGEYQVASHSRLYFRDEVISSLSGPDSLNSVQKQNARVFGVDSDYMQDGRVFSEYRIRDAYSGGDAEAALGLRNRWPLAAGLTATTTAERVHTLSGIATEEATAGSLGLDYTANPIWKGSARVEARDATTSDSLLVTLGAAAKLDADWTALMREALAESRIIGSASGERKQERLQAGIAFRDTTSDVWNALGMIEHRYETDTTQPIDPTKATTEIVSFSGNVQINVPTVLSLRAAAKRVTDDSNALPSVASTELLSGRLTMDVAPRWDVGVSISTLFNGSFDSHELGIGVEGGYNVTANLWISAGYNIFGYREYVLNGSDYTNAGVYLRIRFKFDENLLAGATGGFERPITKPVTGAPP